MSAAATQISAPAGAPFIEVVREFDAPPDLVFRASTEPDLVVQWLGPRDLQMRIIEFDARTGGSYRYVHAGPDGGEYAFRGVFHTVARPALIIQTFEFEGEPGTVSLEARTFEAAGGRTRMRQHATFPSVTARDRVIASGMQRGITDSMDRLGELLATAPERTHRWER